MARKKQSLHKVGSMFVLSFVLGFGFLSGFWINLGFNPKEEIMKIFVKLIQNLFPNPLYSFLFWAIPIVATIFSIYMAFKKGGFLGLLAVALAFSAGLSMPAISAFITLGFALIIGFASPFFKTVKL
ncbi:MAG: hypothetical protein WC758_01950 [Candidatus Woesearchaeota archaeon]|jgi:hypothetical protein